MKGRGLGRARGKWKRDGNGPGAEERKLVPSVPVPSTGYWEQPEIGISAPSAGLQLGCELCHRSCQRCRQPSSAAQLPQFPSQLPQFPSPAPSAQFPQFPSPAPPAPQPSSLSSPSPAPAGSWPPRTVPRTQAGFLGLQMTSVLFSARVLHTAVCTAGPVWGRGCSCSPVRAGIARRGGRTDDDTGLGKAAGCWHPLRLPGDRVGKPPRFQQRSRHRAVWKGCAAGDEGRGSPPHPPQQSPALSPALLSPTGDGSRVPARGFSALGWGGVIKASFGSFSWVRFFPGAAVQHIQPSDARSPCHGR